MVDVGDKPMTKRRSVARGHVALSPSTLTLLRDGELKKGDALAVARIAGIAAAKKTPDLIPLCHPVAITSVQVSVDLVSDGVAIEASVQTADRTGIEMEALTCVAAAALNVIDMVKAVDRGAHITKIWVEKKEGGASGSWERGTAVPVATEQPGTERPVTGEPATMQPAKVGPQVTGTVGVVTVSDRASRKERKDETGPLISKTLASWGARPMHVTVADDQQEITDATLKLINQGAWLVVTTGGTGITSRDVTPQALSKLFDFDIPGVAEALRRSGVGKAPGALLSRSVAGIIGSTAVMTFPGSVGGVRDGLGILSDIIEHLSQQLANGDH